MRFCATPGCPAIVEKGHCPLHARMREASRPLADVRRLYATARWRHLRASILQDGPLCVRCLQEGRYEPATDVDHIRPHRGDLELFWAQDNLQALCHACHSRKTQEEE